MSEQTLTGLAVVGGGPAGLMAAEIARAAGVEVDLFEGRSSVGRKFLVAGKGGLNLTHSEPFAEFTARYGPRGGEVARWLGGFDAQALRQWARELGIETFIGSSGRVFPRDLKAAPLLRSWVRRLRDSGVRFHVQHRCLGWTVSDALRFATPTGEIQVRPAATVLALGGGSWPQLGSDGAWTAWLAERGASVASLKPSNCGFDVTWSEHFAERFAGEPVKPAWITITDPDGAARTFQGEFVITATGVEGSLIYALSAQLRDAIERCGEVTIELDLAPGRDRERLLLELSRPRQGRSLSEFLRRNAGIRGVQAGLVHELISRADAADPRALTRQIKALPLVLRRSRPLAESISSAGGVTLESLDGNLMIRSLPGVFCAGEMLDWEAPTGGYLLAASFASGRIAGAGVVKWLRDAGSAKPSPA
ncbi:MAG: TIGR03862 family flavoprotein [Arenimonas sp.]